MLVLCVYILYCAIHMNEYMRCNTRYICSTERRHTSFLAQQCWRDTATEYRTKDPLLPPDIRVTNRPVPDKKEAGAKS